MRRNLALLVAATTAFEGLRAGVAVLRGLLEFPARLPLGPVAFAHFCRATDLSARGIVFYALYGFGGLVLTTASWLLARRTHAPLGVQRLLAVACLSSLAILALTIPAAPLMFRVGSSPDDPLLLEPLLDQFTMWTYFRFLAAGLSFLALLGALTLAASRAEQP